jgi:hypothetical protein
MTWPLQTVADRSSSFSFWSRYISYLDFKPQTPKVKTGKMTDKLVLISLYTDFDPYLPEKDDGLSAAFLEWESGKNERENITEEDESLSTCIAIST